MKKEVIVQHVMKGRKVLLTCKRKCLGSLSISIGQSYGEKTLIDLMTKKPKTCLRKVLLEWNEDIGKHLVSNIDCATNTLIPPSISNKGLKGVDEWK